MMTPNAAPTTNTNTAGFSLEMSSTLLPETEALRLKLRHLSFGLLALGLVGFVGAFATYFLGFFLAICFFFASGISISHTKSARDVMQNSCVFSMNGAFASLRFFFVINAIGSGIGIIFCIAGIAGHLRGHDGGNTGMVVMACVALIACVIGIPANIIAAQTAGQIHEAVFPVTNKATSIAVAGQHHAVVMPQQVGGVQQGDVVMGVIHPTPYGHPQAQQQNALYPAAIPVESSPAVYNPAAACGPSMNSNGNVAPAYAQVQQQPVYNNSSSSSPNAAAANNYSYGNQAATSAPDNSQCTPAV